MGLHVGLVPYFVPYSSKLDFKLLSMNFLKCSTIPLKDIPSEKVATKKKYIPSKKLRSL